MGCDIHLYMEYKNPENTWSKRWDNFGKRISVGRDYYLFGLMAGVRGGAKPIAAPRGIPNDIDYYTAQDYYWFIGDTNETDTDGSRFITLKDAERWGTTIELDDKGNPYRIPDPDLHSASWLTFGEYTSALALAELAYYKDCSPDNPNMIQAVRDLYLKEAHKYLILHKAVAASMSTLENIGYKTRVVFWFDN